MSKYISINNYKTRNDWWYSSCFIAITVAHAKTDYFSNNNNTDKEKKKENSNNSINGDNTNDSNSKIDW